MKHATLYHKPSGGVVGLMSGPDNADFSSYETALLGVYDGRLDPATQYVSGGVAATRTEVSLAPIAPVTVGDSVTISGLPNPCWLRVGADPIEVTGGSATRTVQNAGTIRVSLFGAYVGDVTITVKEAVETVLDADPRWQALREATPQQIEDWLTANVTSLASARQVLKVLLLAVRKLGA